MTYQEYVHQLAEKFTERANELGYKGKKRDDFALEYVVGAAVALSLLPEPPFDLSKLVWIISIRGAFEFAKLATKDTA